jgi:hypothetical protein
MIEGSNTEIAETQQRSVIRASMPAAIERWNQKVAHCGYPELLPTVKEQMEQMYCFGYCDAVYDITVGNVTVQSIGIDPEDVE